MRMINYYIEKIKESNNVNVSFRTYPDELLIEVVIIWNGGFTTSEHFYSKEEVKAFLKGFCSAQPF